MLCWWCDLLDGSRHGCVVQQMCTASAELRVWHCGHIRGTVLCNCTTLFMWMACTATSTWLCRFGPFLFGSWQIADHCQLPSCTEPNEVILLAVPLLGSQCEASNCMGEVSNSKRAGAYAQLQLKPCWCGGHGHHRHWHQAVPLHACTDVVPARRVGGS